jgi:lysozyme
VKPDREDRMNEPLHISPAGIALEKRYEKGPANISPFGFAPRAYRCSAGKPTIGWGHVITDADTFLHTSLIDSNMADYLLRKDNERFEKGIKSLVKVPLAQHEFDALVSLTLNIGLGKADGVAGDFADSTLLRKLNAGDRRGAADEFPKWNKVRDPSCGCLKVFKGLVTRRADERLMFLGGAHV